MWFWNMLDAWFREFVEARGNGRWGTQTNEISGTKRDDTLTGTDGKDEIDGRKGDDVVKGGGGDDDVDGGRGDDTLIYVMADNSGASDTYDGGRGDDTLQLEFTSAEWATLGLRDEVLAYIEQVQAGDTRSSFTFTFFGLTVRNVEAVTVFVDGVEIDPFDAPVEANDDAIALSEDAGLTVIDVTANDTALDGVASVSVDASGVAGTVSVDGTTITFDPAGAYDHLAAGTSELVTLTYTLTDENGSTDTATVEITVEGANDAPEATAITAGEATNDATSFTLDLLSTASDVDDGTDLDIANVTLSNAVVPAAAFSLDPATGAFDIDLTQFSGLDYGDVTTVTVTYDVIDGDGGVTQNTATFDVRGVTGDRVLVGTENADTLLGADGNDTLTGLGAGDYLDGGTGNDRLSGGAGADVFVWNFGQDIITDFSAPEGDQIDLSVLGYTDFFTWSMSTTFAQVGSDLVFTTPEGTTTFENFSVMDFVTLNPNDVFIFA